MIPDINKPNRPTPRALVAHDLSCFGRCALTVVIPTLAALSVQPVPLPTALLSTHTGGFSGFSMLDTTDEMKMIIKHWESLGLSFDAVYTGFLGNAEQVELIADTLDKFGADSFKLVDPVLGDDGKLYSTITPRLVSGMRTLAAKADIITPNITEAHLLLGGDPAAALGLHTEKELRGLAVSLSESFYTAVVITGADTGGDNLATVCLDKSGFTSINHPRVNGSYPGTGDLFASVLLCKLLWGASLHDAAEAASVFVHDTIDETVLTKTPPRDGLQIEKRLHLLTSQIKRNENNE